MGFLGGSEMMIVAVAAVALLWGPKKIPELARSVGDAKREFADAHEGDDDNTGNNE